MRMFISVPMSGRTTEEIKADIERAKTKIMKGMEQAEGITFVHNLIEEPPQEDDNPLYFLGEAIKKMGDCDSVFFCKNWDDARGCRVEYVVAESYDKDIFVEVP